MGSEQSSGDSTDRNWGDLNAEEKQKVIREGLDRGVKWGLGLGLLIFMISVWLWSNEAIPL